ncbi:MAG: TonB family protein [Arenicella sp.]|jgi:TonB family protein
MSTMHKKLFIAFALLLAAQFSFAADMPTDSTKKGMVFDMPEQMPEYPGGGDALDQFVKSHIKYPADAKAVRAQGKVYIQFVVEKDGSITDVLIRKGAHKSLDAEAIRVVKLMPNWKPGSMRGKTVRVRYTLPITFSLS